MRAALLSLIVICSGCKTMEFAMQHPASGVVLMARVVRDPVASPPTMNITVPTPATTTPVEPATAQIAKNVHSEAKN